MNLKHSLLRWLFAIIGIVGVSMGMFLDSVFATETLPDDVINNQVYLPLIMLPDSSIPTFEEQVVMLTNQERLDNGCGPLTVDSRLRLAAEGHSEDMALNDFFSHYAPDGATPWDRIREQGYTYSSAGENIAAGYTSPESVVAGWMGSAGHRDNILNCSFVHIGVGYYYLQNDTGVVNYRHYWTQVFASP